MIKNSILAIAVAAAMFTGAGATYAQGLGGAYLGVNIGYDRGYADVYANDTLVNSSDVEANGYELGVVAGYNIHENGLLYGLEADIGTLNHTGSFQAMSGGGLNQTVTSNLLYLATARARLGADLGGVVPFVTAGFAAGENVLTITDAKNRLSDRSLQVGYSVGAGIEMPLNEQVSIKAEYLYSNIANRNSVSTGNPGNSIGAGHQVHAFRIGANFHY